MYHFSLRGFGCTGASTKRGGLAYLHSTKTIHRDIKGANLPVDLLGIVKLADFGMAKHLSGQAADLSLKGSPYWMAPELMVAVMRKDNSSDLAFAVDIWSLGCTVVEMFTGKPPWSECEGPAAMFKAIKESPPITEMLLSEGKDFLRLCFQRNPADRPSVSTLLEHHFVRNSQQLDVPLHLAFNGMTLIDRAPSPRELPSFKLDQMPMSPTRHAAANVHLISSNGVDGRRRLGESLRGKTAHNQDRHKFMRTSLIFGDVEIPRLGCQAPLCEYD
ncbi:Mitogen-activated protein kinase kinase kinase 5 [Dionaea muscipula]